MLLGLAGWVAGGWTCQAAEGSGPVQRASEWHVFRAADGLTESLTTALAISPRGNVLVRHGEVDAVSLLDGYVGRRLPAPAGAGDRVYQSAAGRVWSVNLQGLWELGESGWVLYPIPELRREAEASPLRAGWSVPLLPAEEDRVLLLLPDRLAEYRVRVPSLQVLKMAEDTGLGKLVDMAAAQDGGVWVAGANGLAKVPGRLRQLTRRTPWSEHRLPPGFGVQNLARPFEDDDGGVTMVGEATATSRRVAVYFDGTNWSSIAAPGESLRFAWRDLEPGYFWGLTATALLRLDATGAKVEKPSVNTARCSDVAVQPRGVFWLATVEGLWRHAPLAWRTPTAATGFVTAVHAAVEDADGRFWCATAGGLLEASQGTWKNHSWPEGFDPVFRAGDSVFALPGGRVGVSATEQLWVFEPGNGRFARVNHPANRRLRKVLRQTADGALCVQTAETGVATHAYALERFVGQRFLPWSEAPPTLDLGNELFFLSQAQNGDLWLGGRMGPALWHEGKWQRFTATDGYSDEGALCWLELPEGRIWCGGLGKISEYDGRTWTVVLSGLDRVSALRRAGDGSVWAATGSGLYRYYKGNWGWVAEEEGLPSSACYTVWEDRRRHLWVGTSRGVSQYFPRADTDAPRTRILAVEQTVEGAGENVVDITFRGRDKWQFSAESRLAYSHRIDEGVWSPFMRETTAVYRDLAAGKHRFEVRATDRNWNLELRPAAQTFDVVVPWYRERRILAVGVAGLVVALALAALATNRHLRLRRSYTEVERKVAERTRELERATEALVHSQKMTALGTLAAGIAHDFNNMLSIIRGSAQIIESNLQDQQKILTRVERIKTVVDQASGIVRAMLGFGRTPADEETTCELDQVVNETIRLLGDRFLKEVRVRADVETQLPPARAARDLLQQMLLNLVLNAADALAEGGEIQLRAGRLPRLPANPVLVPTSAPEYLALSVSDNGCGIAPGVLSRIFEPFFTTKSFSTRRGTGLGLFMVYEFARQMGAGLWVESTPSSGSTFTILIPVAKSKASAPLTPDGRSTSAL
jgi:signal transduction histidine kinase/ligand-binding sensor domain-containing protein